MSKQVGAPVGFVSRQMDTASVVRGWMDGRKKRQKTKIAKRQNKTRDERLYLLGFAAAAKRKPLGGAMDEYREWAEQERLDQINEQHLKYEATDPALLEVLEAEEGDEATEEIIEQEEGGDEGDDTTMLEEADEEGQDDERW
ncbi:MAG: hypothetical protein ACF8OB_15365 [Phycisphaeraceae bacterium JB051]